MTDFLKTVTLTASVKAERISFRLPAMRKKLRAMRHSAESIFVVEYLREVESICKTVLTHESGDQGCSLTKKPWVENLVRLSL
jgi:hypothetical protein